jgi:hypothetical protein
MNLSEVEAKRATGKGRRVVVTILAMAVVVAIAVGGYLLWRATSILGLPIIADPFDLKQDGLIVIPDDENAFTFYRRAHAEMADYEWRRPGNSYSDWSLIEPALLEELDRNRGPLGVWLEGTGRDKAVYIQMRDATWMTTLAVSPRLRSFGHMANLQAFRLQHEGDYAGAWTWVRAGLRSGRHSGMNGFPLERLIGTVIYEDATNQARVWAEDPKVDAALLRKALDDALAIDAMTAPSRDSIRAEFFGAMNSLADPEVREHSLELNQATPKPGPIRRRLDPILATLRHEPERSRRVARLIIANWLAASVLPREERRKRLVRFDKLILFRPGPDEPSPIALEEIARWYKSARYCQVFETTFASASVLTDRDDRARAALIVLIAEQLYKREHGQDPPSVEALVGPYLKAIPPGYVQPEKQPPDGAPR